MSALDGALADVNLAMLVYLVALNVVTGAVIAVASVARSRAQHRNTLVEFQTISHSELTTPLSIIVPVRDEQDEVVRSVRELLDAAYPTLEVIVVNDGSQDGTFDALRHAFSLVEVERVPRARIASRLVLGVYASPLDQRLLVLDKQAGGRGDSVNAGLRFARFPLFCPVDSSMRLDRDALVRMARTFQTHPETVACRASTRIAARGSLLASMQRVGRLRALLLGRLGSIGMLRRDTVVDAGGYDPDAVAEDLELALRLHRHCRDRRLPYRLAFVAHPVATTTAPQDLRTALAQERRRQRGVIESLARHRGMLFRPRYGAIGWLALPYLSLVASLGLFGAVAAYGAAIAAFATGAVDPSLTLALAVLCATSGLTLSLGALLLDESPRNSRLVAATVAESIGYRQLVTLARACAAWAPRRPSFD
jgi:cellulose synthase/poly-beta-1,6-N-acetylglucosamine synthase-like glycosyltransferase